MKPLYAIILSVLILGCFFAAYLDYYKHKDFPPGYGMACDNEGHYSFYHDGFCSGVYLNSSRQGAINDAWKNYDFRHANMKYPGEDYHWHNCETGK